MSVSVMVVNMRGHPLMPTTPRKARRLLNKQKAKVIQRTPFTIQLLYATGQTTQEIILGVDAGYGKIGFAAITAKKSFSPAKSNLDWIFPSASQHDACIDEPAGVTRPGIAPLGLTIGDGPQAGCPHPFNIS